MVQAIETHGTIKGGWMGIKRFCKCHPFARKHYETTKGYDPVPTKEDKK